jgi:hypothetical protein
LISAVALAFRDFATRFCATISGEGTVHLYTFLELAGGTAADVLFRFAGIDELATGCFARSTICGSR